jgi:kinetochore protein NDC80
MMADRRRTLQPNDSGMSRLPMAPPSAMKPNTYAAQQSLRMSLAPGALPAPGRQSLAGPARNVLGTSAPPGSVPRPSVFRPPPSLGQSTSAAYMKTPMQRYVPRFIHARARVEHRVFAHSNNARRGSMMPPAASAASSSQGFSKDPRALRDKPTQTAMWNDVVRWLRLHDYELQDAKVSAVMGLDFRKMFQHLVMVADPDYAFPVGLEETREKGRWEPEMLGALAHVGYPFAGTIDLKWLATPTAMHSWPSLLGMLHFLVELGKVRCIISEHSHMLTVVWAGPRGCGGGWAPGPPGRQSCTRGF